MGITNNSHSVCISAEILVVKDTFNKHKMAQQVRLEKYADFNPEPNKWRNDKRNYLQATESLEVLVAKNFSTMALPCVAIYPEMDIKKGNFLGFKVAAPDGPLRQYFEQDDTKKIIYDLMKDAVVDALAKKEKKRAGNVVEATAGVVKVMAVMKPPRPIWSLTLKEIETYFSSFKSVLAAHDGIKLKRKWPKIVEGAATELPTNLPSLDEVAEKILPSSAYIPFKKFSLGNLHWRLKLLCSYLLMKNNLDPNTYARNIPEGFKAVKFSLDDLKSFSDDVDKSAKDHNKKQKKKKPTEIEGSNVPFYLEDDGANYDWSDDENDTAAEDLEPEVDNNSSTSATSQPISLSLPSTQLLQASSNAPAFLFGSVDSNSPKKGREVPGSRMLPPGPSASDPPGTSAPSGPTGTSSTPSASVSRTLPINSQLARKIVTQSFENRVERTLPNGSLQLTVNEPADCFYDLNENDDILNISHHTGTPQQSVEENSDDELLALLDVEADNDEQYLEMMQNTDIRKLLTAEGIAEPILQISNFQNLSQGKCYRAHANDGKVATTKFAFTAELNKRIIELIGTQPIIKITSSKLYNGSFIVVTDFEIVKVLETSLGFPEYLTDRDYEQFKVLNATKKHDNLPSTPTLVNKKLTNKHVEQIEVVPGRPSSQRMKNRSQGSLS